MNRIKTYLEYLKMVDATKFTGTGDWLKAEELNGKTLTLIVREVEVISFDNEQGKDEKLGLLFKGKEKGIILNKTNTKNLVEAFGGDTDNWIGKDILARPNPTPLGLGFSVTAAPEGDPDDEIPFNRVAA